LNISYQLDITVTEYITEICNPQFYIWLIGPKRKVSWASYANSILKSQICTRYSVLTVSVLVFHVIIELIRILEIFCIIKNYLSERQPVDKVTLTSISTHEQFHSSKNLSIRYYNQVFRGSEDLKTLI